MFQHFILSTISQALAKEILMSRKAVNRLYENKAQLNSISMHLGESVGMIFQILTFSCLLLCTYVFHAIYLELNCCVLI